MATLQTSTETTLNLRRTFMAPREKVFQAFTEAEIMKKWWGPEEFTCPTAEIDLKVGGKYRIAMKPPEGDVFYVKGTYREIKPPERLVYTFQWEGAGMKEETLVTLEFHEKGDATELVLVHELFPDANARDDHNKGWESSFDCLAEALS